MACWALVCRSVPDVILAEGEDDSDDEDDDTVLLQWDKSAEVISLLYTKMSLPMYKAEELWRRKSFSY
ncbi:hypothetical protein F2Q69_00002213 [Brassica cretica]|uniref:Uncharacterized protein n=1 Tax=Brassica cretica TaxID=69181 RepID=A0A8S9P6Q4_BRACR|nr:hypothetical protein F2Q69_00002213 [Brassica cretica]